MAGLVSNEDRPFDTWDTETANNGQQKESRFANVVKNFGPVW